MLEQPWSKREKKVIISKDVRKGNPCTHLMVLWIVTVIMESHTEVPQKIKSRTTTYDPVIPLLGLYPKEMVARTGGKGKWGQIWVRAYKVQIMQGEMRSDMGQSIQSSDYARWVLKPRVVVTVINTVLYIRHFAGRVGLTCSHLSKR